MITLSRFIGQCYRDSVSLMQFAQTLKTWPGVAEASAIMATAANLALLLESGLIGESLSARPDDLLLVLKGEGLAESDLDRAEALLLRPPAATNQTGAVAELPESILTALAAQPELNFALISVPGEYAAAEGLKALAGGLHVMLFSDNVSLDQEIFLKDEALRRGLLLLGPDCGTAIVNGVPLGFANQVRRGPIGVVSASGTGLQEVVCLLDRWGSGISQALGIGGRDLKEAVGGRSALACLELLENDSATRVVLIVSKPPAKSVLAKLAARLATYTKPVVTCFVGDAASPNLTQAARKAFMLAEGREPELAEPAAGLPNQEPIFAGGAWLRGLYSGGTLCAEAAAMAARRLGEVRSNVVVPGVLPLEDPWTSHGHCLVDLGEDEFTRGRPHPMIDQGLRLQRLAREAADPTTAAILIDIVLGHGAHPDQAGELAAFRQTLLQGNAGRWIPMFASVTGTEADPQGWSRSLNILRSAGIAAYGSNAAAVGAALAFLATIEVSP